MNILLSCIGKRGYIADFFRAVMKPGDTLIGSSNSLWTPGFAACDISLLMPPIASDEYLPAVVEACARYEVSGILSFFDPDVVALSAGADQLRSVGAVPVMPSHDTAVLAFDKWLTFEGLSARGFRVPHTVLGLDEALDALDSGQLCFPLVVKPRHGYGSADTFVARDAAQLRAFVSVSPDQMIQQLVDGDTYNLDVLAALDGTVIESVAWRRYQSRLGETEQAETVAAPALVELGVRLAEAIDLVGPMDVDLFVPTSGEPIVLELNPRFGGGYPVSHLAGAAFPAEILADLRGEHPAPRIGSYLPGVVMMKTLGVIGGLRDEVLTAQQVHAAKPPRDEHRP